MNERAQINRMKFLLYTLTGIMIAAALAFGENARPNILLITSEDNGPELGCYGEPYVQTPNLDRLAESGIAAINAFRFPSIVPSLLRQVAANLAHPFSRDFILIRMVRSGSPRGTSECTEKIL